MRILFFSNSLSFLLFLAEQSLEHTQISTSDTYVCFMFMFMYGRMSAAADDDTNKCTKTQCNGVRLMRCRLNGEWHAELKH